MRPRRLRAAVAVVMCAASLGAAPRVHTHRAPRAARTPEPVAPALPGGPGAGKEAKGWIVVDVGTGGVIAASNPHTSLRPASVIKVLTALIAAQALPPDASVPGTALGEHLPPFQIGMRPGQVWTMVDVLHAALMTSANDAAVALAERVGGTRTGFAADMAAMGRRLGLVDDPVLRDPAGLDDGSALDGGDQISAYDLAIVGRAALAVPLIADIVARRPPYRFAGPDGKDHEVRSQNRLLESDPTVIGVKPGYTSRAGATLMAAARRNGRTILTVVLGVAPAAMYSTTVRLLDAGFASAPSLDASLPHLPPVVLADVSRLAAGAPTPGRPALPSFATPPAQAFPAAACLVAIAMVAFAIAVARRGSLLRVAGPSANWRR